MTDTHQKSDKKYADAVILTIMLSAVIINYFIYSKLAFLDFYFLLVVIAGYTLGKRFAVLGAFFTILMVWIFILANKGEYLSNSDINDIHLNLTVWGGFLVLAAWLIGSLSEKLKEELKESNRLRQDLDRERELLEVSSGPNPGTEKKQSGSNEFRYHRLPRFTGTLAQNRGIR